MGGDGFEFDCRAPLTKVRDGEILEGLRRFAGECGGRGKFLTMGAFDRWAGRPCRGATVVRRLGGTWRGALLRAGVQGARVKAHAYTAEELVALLEGAWRALGRRPGEKTLPRVAAVSTNVYRRLWGSLAGACRAVEAFHRGRMTREELLRGWPRKQRGKIPASVRWAVLKRDRFRCVKCGRGPHSDPPAEIEVDHKHPAGRGGGDQEENLQVLCFDCNRGKGSQLEGPPPGAPGSPCRGIDPAVLPFPPRERI
jgi:HNH endonuclease